LTGAPGRRPDTPDRFRNSMIVQSHISIKNRGWSPPPGPAREPTRLTRFELVREAVVASPSGALNRWNHPDLLYYNTRGYRREEASELIATADEPTRTVKFGVGNEFHAELRRRVDTFFRITGRRRRDCG